jgi:hypothetical protein
MKTEFDEWFDEKYGHRQHYGRGVAKEAWDEAMNRGVKYGKEDLIATKVLEV